MPATRTTSSLLCTIATNTGFARSPPSLMMAAAAARQTFECRPAKKLEDHVTGRLVADDRDDREARSSASSRVAALGALVAAIFSSEAFTTGHAFEPKSFSTVTKSGRTAGTRASFTRAP